MSNILILGAGSMGTAFSFPCSDNNHSVTIVGTHLENNFIDKINNQKIHPALGCKIPKNVSFVKFENLSSAVAKDVNLIVVAVTSQGIEWAGIELSKVLKKNIPILILTKGLSVFENKYEILAHKMERLLKSKGINENNISAAGGPCLAKGLANRVHTSVIFANSDINIVKNLSKMISTEYYHVFTSTDVAGVEICAAIKNIFSMAIGASKGLCAENLPTRIREENYLNTAASLIQESIYEMIYFVEKLNGKKETVIGLAGLGDLYVSADGGRNSKMGEYLGLGMTYKEAKATKMLNETVEGAQLIFEIGSKIIKDYDAETLPLMTAMVNTILKEKPLSIEWKKFK